MCYFQLRNNISSNIIHEMTIPLCFCAVSVCKLRETTGLRFSQEWHTKVCVWTPSCFRELLLYLTVLEAQIQLINE